MKLEIFNKSTLKTGRVGMQKREEKPGREQIQSVGHWLLFILWEDLSWKLIYTTSWEHLL